MNASPLPEQPSRLDRLGLNRWLQLFLTIISGTIVMIIAWTVIERFISILILLLASFLVAYLLGPIVSRLQRTGASRLLSILLVYLAIIGALTLGIVLLLGPLTAQLEGLSKTLPTLADSRTGALAGLSQFFQEHGIPINVADLRSRIIDYVSGAGTSILGGTLAVVAGLVTFVTDLFLILAITFYLLLDGQGMHNRAVRLLPASYRERWFFLEATLNSVVGGYIRGQLIVALTIGVGAGVGSALLGVNYPLVIGLLAFLFEFIPLIGPVLGMVVALGISLFQPFPLVIWVLIYFIILQQIEANVIVPRVSGHAVGLHPLAALLALLAVPVAGVLYVLLLALYADLTSQTQLLVATPRTTAYASLRQVLRRRRVKGTPVPLAASTTTVVAPAPVVPAPETVPNERLASIAQDQAQLMAKFEANEASEADAGQNDPPTADSATNSKAPEDQDTPSVV